MLHSGTEMEQALLVVRCDASVIISPASCVSLLRQCTWKAQVFGAELGLRLPNPALLAAELLQPPSMRACSVFTSSQASPVVQLHASLADAVRRTQALARTRLLPCLGGSCDRLPRVGDRKLHRKKAKPL